MNWGYRILIVIVLFIAGMGFMLSVAMKQKNEMIDDNYYVKELHHQEQIDAANNLSAMTERLVVAVSEDGIDLRIPAQARDAAVKGSVVFLRSSDQRLDKSFPMTLDENGIQKFPAHNFVRGQYTLRVSWHNGNKAYYHEENVIAL